MAYRIDYLVFDGHEVLYIPQWNKAVTNKFGEWEIIEDKDPKFYGVVAQIEANSRDVSSFMINDSVVRGNLIDIKNHLQARREALLEIRRARASLERTVDEDRVILQRTIDQNHTALSEIDNHIRTCIHRIKDYNK